MKTIFLTVLSIFLISNYIFSQDNCQDAIRKANIDFQNAKYSLHSEEIVPVENTFLYVIEKYFKINWYFTDSLKYYACYDSIMTKLLDTMFGFNFFDRAHVIADSLEKTKNWRKDPEFPGGQEELFKFIYSRIAGLSIKNNTQKTKIIVVLEIDTIGNVINPKVVRGINRKIDKKVIEIVEQLPNFNPAYLYGKPIRYGYNIPINLNFK
jgi:hypothetical protein